MLKITLIFTHFNKVHKCNKRIDDRKMWFHSLAFLLINLPLSNLHTLFTYQANNYVLVKIKIEIIIPKSITKFLPQHIAVSSEIIIVAGCVNTCCRVNMCCPNHNKRKMPYLTHFHLHCILSYQNPLIKNQCANRTYQQQSVINM